MKDQAAADPAFAPARELATAAGDELTLSADLAASDGDRDAARELLDEAAGLAADGGAHGVGRWVEEARVELGLA